MSIVNFTQNGIALDGENIQIISGAIHYFRVPRELWWDRIAKAKMMGLNAIETYMCWNLHEPREGVFDLTGNLDFCAFIEVIQAQGLLAIVRPGPYICSEWDNGGLPGWLMVKPDIRLRRNNPVYLGAVSNYFDKILPMIRKLQYTKNGPIIALQVENEYGSYSCDKDYIRALVKFYADAGLDVPYFTADGAGYWCLQGGQIPEVVSTLNCGSRFAAAFKLNREFCSKSSDFVMEFWNGWFGHWGEPLTTRTAEDAAQALDEILALGGSANLYMFHGGTNFGFLNGANKQFTPDGFTDSPYQPVITSYDSDAPLNEYGETTEKFFAFQKVIKKYRPDAAFGVPAPVKKIAYDPIALTSQAGLFANLDKLSTARQTIDIEPMEKFGQSFGFINYHVKLAGPTDGKQRLFIYGLRDRAQVFIDKKPLGTIYRNDPEQFLSFELPPEGGDLDILAENLGRINYGPEFGKELKGIDGSVCVFWQEQLNWTTRPLPLDNLDELQYAPVNEIPQDMPTFFRGEFSVDDRADTFLEFPGVKGVVWINGFNIGRYWNIGPGATMYVPGCLLRPGRNEIVVFELHRLKDKSVTFRDKHIIK